MKQETNKQITALAFDGNWGRLMPLLRAHPDLVNSASTTKDTRHCIRQRGTVLRLPSLESYWLLVPTEGG